MAVFWLMFDDTIFLLRPLKRSEYMFDNIKLLLITAAGKSLDYNYQTSRLFVGMENGLITEFHVADDYNKLTFQKNYISHSDQVNGLLFSLPSEWLLSVSRDKFFCWYCAETARRIGGYLCGSCCTAVQ